MRCPSCDYENRAERRFCAECGAALAVICAACGTVNEPGEKFCGGCGAAIVGGRQTAADSPSSVPPPTPSSLPTGDRRQLTVMFCDLVGSTDLSQRLDAEDLHAVVRAYQQEAAQAIARYEGHIAQYLGDGLLVYFGYPRAHEDAAERAVRTGREILNGLDDLNVRLEGAYGIRLAARIGIHTGPVVIGTMGGGARSEVLALGETTNIAARLEAIAAPNSVVISGATQRLVPGMFLLQDLGTPALKGVSTPIRAYAALQATGIRSRLDVDPNTLTPLVARDQDLGLLVGRWEQAQEGAGQGVLIAGEAGLGKSRLVQAFRGRLAEVPHTWLECRCSPYTEGSAFHPLIELVEQGLGFKPDDNPETKLRRLESGLESVGLSLAEGVPLVAALLLLPLPDRYRPSPLGPELQRKKTMEILVAWTLALSGAQPLVMLFEDLHWCDPSTIELLTRLLAQIPTSRVLTLLTSRPSFTPPWPASSHVATLAVSRLSRRQAMNMIAAMTRSLPQGGPLPDAVVERIAERADGVPLFIEEMTKMVLESDPVAARGARRGQPAELAIPSTLQDSLMARLDRLDSGKEVAQLGAAIGREFSYALLCEVARRGDFARDLDDALQRLVTAELLYQRGMPPQSRYIFKHALIQETAYQSLLKSMRQRVHTHIAQVLEERFPERAATEPEMIARHYDQAGLATSAIEHYRRAGARATQRSANEEAMRNLRRALALTATLPETAERHQQELALQLAIGVPIAAARGWSHPEYEETFVRARELATQLGDSPELARVLIGLAGTYYMKGDVVRAAEVAREALAAAKHTGNELDLLTAHHQLGQALFYLGEFGESLRNLEQTMALYDLGVHGSQAHAAGIDRGVAASGLAAQCHLELGWQDRALQLNNAAVALARRIDHPLSLAVALFNAAEFHAERREFSAMQQYTDELVSLADRLGFPLYAGAGRVLQGVARVDTGDVDGGIADIRKAMSQLAGIGTGLGAPQLLALLAEILLKVGRHEEAQRVISLGAARAQAQRQAYYDAELQRLQAGVLVERGGETIPEAETLLRESLAIARRQEAKTFELRATVDLARVLRRDGRVEEGRAMLAEVYAWFSEGFDTRDLREARSLLAELSG